MNRSFLGVIDPKNEKVGDNMVEGLTEKEYYNFHKKHLKAYLKGYEYFTYKGKVYKVRYNGEEGRIKSKGKEV